MENREFKTIKSITFNTLGNEQEQSHIILIDNIGDSISELSYIYISARTERDENGDLNVLKKDEILIKKNNNSKDNKEDSYFVDCSRLFKIEKTDFDSLIKNNKNLNFTIIKTTELDYNYALKIFDQIMKLSNSKPPYITLSHISYDSSKNIITPDLEYASESHLLKDANNSNLDNQHYFDENHLRIVWYIIRKNKYDYYYSKVIMPLAIWIRQNQFLDDNKTTKDIIELHNNRFLQGEKIAAKLINIYDVNIIKSFRFANKQLKENDLKYAQKYYDKGWDFESFKSYHTSSSGEWLFDFNWLKKEYIIEQEKKKQLEKSKPAMGGRGY